MLPLFGISLYLHALLLHLRTTVTLLQLQACSGSTPHCLLIECEHLQAGAARPPLGKTHWGFYPKPA